jgi:CDP-diacylglycerol--serine O-phosphatidyltransferase
MNMKMKVRDRVRTSYRDIYLLPSSCSLGNLFFGFLSLFSSFRGRFAWAGFWVICAATMDALDGIVARSSRTHSDFGRELDSLADAVSFGAAPAILLYFWGLRSARTAGLFFAFVYLAAGVLRLARYNVRSVTQPDRRFYTGLTIPSSSMFLSSVVFLHPQPLAERTSVVLIALLALFLAFCMISTIPYRNFMSFNLRKRIDIRTALLIAILISTFIFYPKIFLVSFFTINVLSGPATALARRFGAKIFRRGAKKETSLKKAD